MSKLILIFVFIALIFVKIKGTDSLNEAEKLDDGKISAFNKRDFLNKFRRFARSEEEFNCPGCCAVAFGENGNECGCPRECKCYSIKNCRCKSKFQIELNITAI
jgi:hypothetical protein